MQAISAQLLASCGGAPAIFPTADVSWSAPFYPVAQAPASRASAVD